MAQHHFHYSAQWPGGRNAVGSMESGTLRSQISIATGMGGPGAGTNPDELLLSAAATCYLMTLAAMIERAGVAVQGIALKSEITIDVTNGIFRVKKIIHHPQVVLAADAGTAARARVADLQQQAGARCMLSRALQGNVEIAVEPKAAAEPQ